MRAIIGSIDNRADFEKYMQGFNAARGSTRAPRRAGQYEENFVSLQTVANFLDLPLK